MKNARHNWQKRTFTVTEKNRDRIRRHISSAILAAAIYEHKRAANPTQMDIESIAKNAADNLLRDYRMVPR